MESVVKKEDIEGHKLRDLKAEPKEFRDMETNKTYTRNIYTCYDEDEGTQIQFYGSRVLDKQFDDHEIDFSHPVELESHKSKKSKHSYWVFQVFKEVQSEESAPKPEFEGEDEEGGSSGSGK